MDIKIKLHSSIKDIEKSLWGQLIGNNFPFLEYDFLLALESSQSIGEEAGWLPYYVCAWKDEVLEGALLLYLKDNSYGEYIFDWQWARAYDAHGLNYFPKILSAIPFTPATCHKLLVRPGGNASKIIPKMIEKSINLMKELQCSSLHFLFIPEEENIWFERSKFFIRHSFQYHWENQNYENFDHFLALLKRKKRCQIQRERKQLPSSVKTFVLTGDDLKSEHAKAMYEFYLSTIYKMGAIPYLKEPFFESIFENLKDHIVLMMAKEGSRWIAGALNFQKGDCLYGRYWGCNEEVRYLHFELCYYLTIDYAIKKGLKRFEAGAQGEHKIFRGFLPKLTYSAHWIADPKFRGAIVDFVTHEKKAIEKILEQLHCHSPFKG